MHPGLSQAPVLPGQGYGWVAPVEEGGRIRRHAVQRPMVDPAAFPDLSLPDPSQLDHGWDKVEEVRARLSSQATVPEGACGKDGNPKWQGSDSWEQRIAQEHEEVNDAEYVRGGVASYGREAVCVKHTEWPTISTPVWVWDCCDICGTG